MQVSGDGLFGIAAAFSVIGLGVVAMVVYALRQQRAIERDGFTQMETLDNAIADATVSLFGKAPTEIQQKDDSGGPSWLVFVGGGASEDAGCAMRLYDMGEESPSPVIMIRSGRRIPDFLRRLQDGMIARAEPLDDAEADSPMGPGWFIYGESDAKVPPPLIERLSRISRHRRAVGLLGVALTGPYLAVWTDAQRIRSLLAAAPVVRSAFGHG